MSDEIVRRLRKNSQQRMRALKESMPILGLREEDEENEEDIMTSDEDTADVDTSSEDSGEELPDDTGDVTTFSPTGSPSSEELPSGEDEEPEASPDDEDALDAEEKDDNEHVNPLDNDYAVHYTIGQEVALAYSNGTSSKLKGIIDGYDPEGFYRIQWANGLTTNGITDIALADIVAPQEESACVCGSNNFINEEDQVICDNCGRIKESSDPLTLADKSRPKGKKMIRSEAHPVSTANKPNISEAIKKAFNKKKLQENEEVVWSKLKMHLDGKFWTDVEELASDIEELGFSVEDVNAEYITVVCEHDECEDEEFLLYLGGTARTIFIDFEKTSRRS